MQYDVIIVGSGPGGYIAAIRCAQLGMKTAIVERYPTLGGTCLNVGCIPSKALLDSSEHYYNAKANFAEHGIGVKGLDLDISQMMKRRAKVVTTTSAGITYLMKKNKIEVHQGHGSFVDKNTILVKGEKGEQKITGKNIIIATGSKPSTLPGVEIDKQRVITSTEALQLKEVPSELVVIGAGIIGLELGSVYARLGSKVSVVEYTANAIPTMDASLGKELHKVLVKELGIEFHFEHKVTGAKAEGDRITVTADNKKGEQVTFNGDYCLVAVGRRPYTDSLELKAAGLSVDERGRVSVNDLLQTSVSNIYAIGDVVRGAMLAHKAEEEGVFVAEHLAGQKPHINYNLIPSVVYTWPEVAGVGATEGELTEQKREFKSGSFPFMALGRARASGDLHGFVKVLADKSTDEILGVHMIGARAADMIGEAVIAMEFRAAAEDIARSSHAHPTFSEAFKEACLAATDNRALNI